MKFAVCLAALVAVSTGTIFYQEDFSGDWESRWVQSQHKSDYGKFEVVVPKYPADAEGSKGLKTTQDARFYAISSKLDTPVDATAGSGVLVVQFEVKHEQNIDCGGGYVKLLPAAYDAVDFHGETPYYVMFGPDICGATRKVHLIFNHRGENLLWKREISAPSDDATHLFTLVVDTKRQTYEVLLDGEKKEGGPLENDWAFLKAKEIDDPTDKKPSDWVDVAEMDDPSDEKPEGWDEVAATIADPDAKRPEDWDEEEDGQWEPPTIANPEYKGEWRPKRIPNPEYKGVWAPRRIANPEYVEDKELASYKDIGGVGFDLWQVRSGTIFDKIVIGDDVAEVAEYAARTYHANKDLEKKAKENADDASRKKAEEEAASAPKDDEAADAPEQEDDELL